MAQRKRVTIEDIARQAGVGVATVDRVLNKRARVRRETAERVLAAAEDLGYHGERLLRNRVAELVPERTFGFLLQKRDKPFYQSLARALEAECADMRDLRVTSLFRFVESLSADNLCREIETLAAKVDVLAIVAIDHPKVHEAVARVVEAGKPVFALLSPISSRAISGHIGIESRKAGRTAGWAMGLCLRKGQVGILVGSHRYIGHEELEGGFRSYMREHAPAVTLRESIVYLDDAAVAYESALELFDRNPELAGLYHCGGGASGVIRALRETGRGGDIVYICHEGSQHTIDALVDGVVDMVIETPVDETARQTVAAMSSALTGNAPTFVQPPRFRVLTPENI